MTTDDDDLRGTGRTPIPRVRYPDPGGTTTAVDASSADTASEAAPPGTPASQTTSSAVDPTGSDDDAQAGEPATVVSGRVGTWDEAAVLRQSLVDVGFLPTDLEVFYTGPAGRHAVTAIGGDAQSDAGSTHVAAGAATGAAAGSVAGLVAGAALATAPLAVPIVFTAAAIGAFGGALAGGVGATEDGADKVDTAEHPVARPGGIVVAVRVDHDPDDESRALRCLRAAGAIALERATARWRDGSWVDWSPVAPREQIAPEPGTPQA